MNRQSHNSSAAAEAERASESEEMHGPPAPPDSIGDLLTALSQLARDSADQAEAIVTLGLMEFQLSAASLKRAAGLCVVLGFGLFITWGLAITTMVFVGIWGGLSLPLALLLCTLLNAGVTLWLFKTLRNTRKNIGFTKLRQFLKGTENERTGR